MNRETLERRLLLDILKNQEYELHLQAYYEDPDTCDGYNAQVMITITPRDLLHYYDTYTNGGREHHSTTFTAYIQDHYECPIYTAAYYRDDDPLGHPYELCVGEQVVVELDSGNYDYHYIMGLFEVEQQRVEEIA